jgi:hypothetical protein
VLRTIVWVVGGIFALDIALVALIAVYAMIDRGRSRRQIRDLEAIWDLEPRPVSGGGRGSARPLGGRLTAAVAVVAMIFAGTAVASPDARRMVASVFGSVARQLGIGDRDGGEAAERIGVSANVPLGPVTGPAHTPAGGAASAGSQSRSAQGGAHPTTGTPAGSTPGPSVGPGSPTSVTAAPSSSSQIDLAWADVSGESGYQLERSLDDTTGWNAIGSTGAGETTYSDVGLDSSTTYFYRVTATDPGIDSPPSGVVSATTHPDPPSQPTITAITATSTDVDLAWADVGGETGYGVERSLDGAVWTTIATTGQDVTTYHDSWLTPGTTYWYRIVASNAGGDSPASESASVTTSADALSPTEVEPTP